MTVFVPLPEGPAARPENLIGSHHLANYVANPNGPHWRARVRALGLLPHTDCPRCGRRVALEPVGRRRGYRLADRDGGLHAWSCGEGR